AGDDHLFALDDLDHVVADLVDQALTGSETAHDPVVCPGRVDLGQHEAHAPPASPLATLGRLADLDGEEGCSVAIGLGHSVCRESPQTAEPRHELAQNGRWIGFGVRLDGTPQFAGKAIVGGLLQRLRPGCRWRDWFWFWFFRLL